VVVFLLFRTANNTVYLDLVQIHDFQDRCLLWCEYLYLQVNLVNETDIRDHIDCENFITQTEDLSLLSKIFEWF
jgi:hypothetical protein